MISIERLYRFAIFSFLSIIGLTVFVTVYAPSAYADGGAPQLAYVSGTSQGISVITIAQQRVTQTIPLAKNPQAVLLSLDGGTLYVAQPLSGQVAAIDTHTGKLRCAAHLPGQPSLLALSLDTTLLYVAGQGDTRVRALDPATCTVRRTFEAHTPIYGLATAASTDPRATPLTPNQLWITGRTSLTVFDSQGHFLGTIPVPGGPQNISIPAGFTAYVTTRQGTLVAIDLYTHRVFRTLLSNGDFGKMDYDAITGEIYVPDRQHNRLDVLEPVTLMTKTMPSEPARALPLGASPQAVAITSDGQLGFVALSNGQVAMLDIVGYTLIKSITVGGTPNFIITGLYPPTTGLSPAPLQPGLTSEPSQFGMFLLIGGLVVVAGVCALIGFRFLGKRKV